MMESELIITNIGMEVTKRITKHKEKQQNKAKLLYYFEY